MKQLLAFWILFTVLAAALHADGGVPGSYAVKDALGRTVLFPKVPERIVVAGRAVVSIVNALYLFPGVGRRVIGVGVTDQGLGDFFPRLDASSSDKVRFPNDAGVERIAALKPDLVILKTYMKEPLGTGLSSIGIPVLYVDLESPDGFYADLLALGETLRQADRARTVIDFYQARIRAVTEAATGRRRPGVLLLSASESGGERAFTVPPAAWIQSRIVETAGGEAAWKSAATGSGWSKIGFEQIAAWNPEYILVVSYKTPAAVVVERLRNSPDWKELRAVREGKLFAFPADFYSWDQPDTRWILGLEWLAAVLHRDALPGLDMREEISSFYSDLYGIGRESIEKDILPRLSPWLERK
jgi:iron complex transport system substrate-binding protein